MSKAVTEETVRRAVPDADVRSVANKRSLIEALLDRSVPAGAIVQVERFDEERRAFFESVVRHFPMLPIVVVVRGATVGACPDSVECVDAEDGVEALERDLAEIFSRRRETDRRRNNRFEWPIRAYFADGDGTVHEVSEISAGGAFLEPHGPIGARDGDRTIELFFQNFSITTTCRVLDTRFVSSRKANGFRIKFVSLSDRAREFIDRVINDAIVQLLLDPSTTPQMPTIEEDDLVLEMSTEFALS